MHPKRPLFAASGDLAAGQTVIVTARWILILAGLVFVLWDPSALGDLRIQLMVLFLLSLFNFYLQLQTLTRRAISAEIVYVASAADLSMAVGRAEEQTVRLRTRALSTPLGIGDALEQELRRLEARQAVETELAALRDGGPPRNQRFVA